MNVIHHDNVNVIHVMGPHVRKKEITGHQGQLKLCNGFE